MLALANGNRGGIDEPVITEMAAVLAPGPFIVAGGVSVAGDPHAVPPVHDESRGHRCQRWPRLFAN